jgi:hypothetical protein
MDRNSSRRIWKVEEHLSAARKEREEKRKKKYDNNLLHARFHATAVAAIVLSGEPKIEEPLIRAWTRALQHYGIPALQQHGINLSEAARTKNQVEAARRLGPVILRGAEKSARFAEIFRTSPVWLLNFTGTHIDAGFLNFNLPDKSERLKWGSAGYDESRRWPLLPLGTMTDGDPVSDEDARLWPLPLMNKADTIADFEDNLSQKNDDNSSPTADLLEDMTLAMDLAENPEKEKELSRYEKHRLRDVFEYLALRRRQRVR